MTEPAGTVELKWECDVCGATLHVARVLRLGESAADAAKFNTDDLDAVRKRHKHESNKE